MRDFVRHSHEGFLGRTEQWQVLPGTTGPVDGPRLRAGHKRTPQRAIAIVNALRAGSTRRIAAASAGIDHATLYRWLDFDPAFRAQVERAEAEAEVRCVSLVAKAASTNWRAAAWWLERRRPADYGRHARLGRGMDVPTMAERIAAAEGLDAAELTVEIERIVARLAARRREADR